MRNCKKLVVIWGIMAMLPRSLVLAQESKVLIDERNETAQLRTLVDTGLNAARLQNKAKLEGIARDLTIPDPLTWFVDIFGKEQGAMMASAYHATLEREEKKIPWLFERLTKREGELLIQNAATTKSLGSSTCAQSLLNSTKGNSSFYRVGLEWNSGPNTKGFWALGYFTLVGGKYRRLDCEVLGLGSDGIGASGLLHGLPILKVKGPEQATKILYSVPPVYPEEARRNRISGEVKLHVLLARDGTVEDIEVLSGHAQLQDAALEAVRQWRYRRTLVRSRPVEVDTVVEINFAPSN